MISGAFKVIHFYGRPEIPMLFDVSVDIGEVTNIARRQREIHEDMYDGMMHYLEEVGARFPKVNPEYDPDVYREHKDFARRTIWGPFEGRRTLEDDEI